MDNSTNDDKQIEIDYAGNAVLVFSVGLLGYVALAGFGSTTIDWSTQFILACLIALTLAIIYVGIQVGRISSKLK
ncbi:MAG: hypothetical protein OEV85_00350 [Candidatus Thorarchaeota archaeon]|nr:hypothetical protein [Candidatus Thorarchaeota archaeon]